jgi:hypothetical protein
LNSLHQRIICTKFDLFWPAGSGEDFKKKILCIFILLLLSPLGEGLSPSYKALEFSPSKDDLCQVWLKLAQWFWRKRFLNDPNPFLHFCDYLPFEEDLTLYLNKLEFISPNDNLYQV